MIFMLFLFLIFFLLGVIMIIFPYRFWKIRDSMKLSSEFEPSVFEIDAIRFRGLVVIIISTLIVLSILFLVL
ncbi:DUF6199 family natural product biosynthesis protein [Chengkuizengella marina]|uniref:DUF6199 family natural product biosynthesis protein n=1 Tax=Chengkuizengella marina TaxID=2507566 RepID=UPI0038B252A9